MRKLFKSIIYSFFQNFLQVVSLLMLILILLVILLGIFSSNSAMFKQYSFLKDQRPQHDARINSVSDAKFKTEKNFFTNLNYFANKEQFNAEQFRKATLSIKPINDNDQAVILKNNPDVSEYLKTNIKTIYKVTICSSEGNNVVNIGCSTSKTYNYGYWYVNAQQIIPGIDFNELMLKYSVFDYFHLITTGDEAQINIINEELSKIKSENEQDIFLESVTTMTSQEHKQLWWMMAVSLYSNRVEYDETLLVNDLLISGKYYLLNKYTKDDYFKRPYIIEKQDNFDFNTKNYAYIFKRFAELNNLKIGSKIYILGQEIVIDGYATSERYSFFKTPLGREPSLKDSTVLWVNENTFNDIQNSGVGALNKLTEMFYITSRNNSTDLNFSKEANKKLYGSINNNMNFRAVELEVFQNTIAGEETWGLFHGNVSLTQVSLNDRLNIINSVATTFSFLIMGVSLLIIFLLISKTIKSNEKSFGMLKALGLTTSKIALVMTVAQMISIVFISLVSLALSWIVQSLFNQTYIDFFVFANYQPVFNFYVISLIIIIPLIFIAFFAFLFTFILLGKSSLSLLYKTQTIKIRIPKIFRLGRLFGYKTKITFLFLSNSLTKIILAFFITLFSATLLFFSLSTSRMVDSLLEKQWNGVKFNYLYNYKSYASDLEKMYDDKTIAYSSLPFDSIADENNILNDLLKRSDEIQTDNFYDLSNKWIKSSQLKMIVDWLRSDQNIPGFPNIDLNIRTAALNYIDSYPYLRDYFTGTNISNDIIISFGDIFYDSQDETMINTFKISSYKFSIENFNTVQKTESAQANHLWDIAKYSSPTSVSNINVIRKESIKYLEPNLKTKSLDDFFTFDINDAYHTYKEIFTNIQNYLNSDPVTLVPLLVQENDARNYGLNIGDLISLNERNSDFSFINKDSKKPLFGYVYDTFNNLISSTGSLFTRTQEFNKYTHLASNYHNTKLSFEKDHELQRFFSVVSSKNNYQIMFEESNLQDRTYFSEFLGLEPSIDKFINVAYNKYLSQKFSNSISILIATFALGAVFVAMIIIFMAGNVLISDNIRFIKILNIMGYSYNWIIRRFALIFIPVSLIAWGIAIPLAYPVISILTGVIKTQTGVEFLPYFLSTDYIIVLAILVVLFAFSFAFSWLLLIYNKQKLTLQ